VKGFDPIHHPGDIFGDGHIAAPQLFHSANSMLSVVDRLGFALEMEMGGS
jgi:cobalamin-dependent methionine synthase I